MTAEGPKVLGEPPSGFPARTLAPLMAAIAFPGGILRGADLKSVAATAMVTASGAADSIAAGTVGADPASAVEN